MGLNTLDCLLSCSWCIEDRMKKDKNKVPKEKEKLKSLKTDLVAFANKHSLPLELRTKGMKERDKKVRTLHLNVSGSC